MTVDVSASSSPIGVTVSGATVSVDVKGGPTGPQGPAGPQGPTGPQGPAGATGPSGGISDAPSDGTSYARRDAAWIGTAGPEKAAVQTTPAGVSLAPSFTNYTPLTLSPNGSAWAIEYTAVLANDEISQTHELKVGGFSNLSSIDGFVERIDSVDGTAKYLIEGTTQFLGASFSGLVRVSGIVRVSGASGTLAIGIGTLDVATEGSLLRSYCVARRIA